MGKENTPERIVTAKTLAKRLLVGWIAALFENLQSCSMPRLLPRLIEEVQRIREKAAAEGQKLVLFNRKSKLKHCVTPRLINSNQTFSSHGRNKSILLDAVNPIIHREQFLHKKSRLKKPFIHQDTDEKKDEERTMSLAERGFSSNPYREFNAALCS